METVSLWKSGVSQAPGNFTTWLGSLVTTVAADHPVSVVFLTTGTHSQQLLNWLETDATGPVSVQHLADGRMIIAVGDRVDATMLRSVFAAEFDFSVVSTSGSPEKVRGFIKNARQPHA